MQIFVIGASGALGRGIVSECLRRGHRVTAQSRAADRVPPWTLPAVGHPGDAGFLAAALPGHDAVIQALGVDHAGPTTLVSAATRAMIAAMGAAGIARLVAITGDRHSPAGWLHTRLLAPLFNRRRLADRDVQEELIALSDLDWTIVRPGPLAEGPLPGALTAIWPVPPDVQVRAVTREEVADYVLDVVEQHRWPHGRPLVGHLA